MEAAVQVPHLEKILFCDKIFLKLHHLAQLFQLVIADILSAAAGGQALDAGADGVDIVDILAGDAHHHGTLVGDVLHQALQLQLHQGLPHRGAAHAQLGGQLALGEGIARLKDPVQNGLFDLFVYMLAQGIAPQGFIEFFHIATSFRQRVRFFLIIFIIHGKGPKHKPSAWAVILRCRAGQQNRGWFAATGQRKFWVQRHAALTGWGGCGRV